MRDLIESIIFYQNKYYYSKIKGLLKEIDSEVLYAIVKGEPLSRLSYGVFGKRYSQDVDILVSRKNINKVKRIILNNGFFQRSVSREINIMVLACSHQLLPYFNVKLNLYLDLNFDIFWGEYEGKRIDIDEFLSDTVEMDIYGVKVKTLPPIKALIQLILHHYKDMNSIFLLATRKSIRYEMFRDVYYLLKNNLDTITIEKLHKMSTEYEIIPYVFYVLYYTGQVFKDAELKGYIEAFRTPEGEALLNCYGLCAKERKEWRYGFDDRLAADNLYELIKDDLTEKDKEKISVNKRVFMGIDE